MKKKIMLGLVAVVVVVAGVAAMSAYEAHVINVTAKIENALRILPASRELMFGTVFPQEHLEERIWITTSDSFCETDQTRVLAIDYKIVQKPKPIWPIPTICDYSQGDFTIEYMRNYCHDNPENLACCYPSLCPYLSKDPIDGDLEPYDDYGVPAFHDPNDPSFVATGTIHKYNDLQDEWIIDLDVPCFDGMCAQEWEHQGWELDPADESKTFGCDLWVEVTKIY